MAKKNVEFSEQRFFTSLCSVYGKTLGGNIFRHGKNFVIMPYHFRGDNTVKSIKLFDYNNQGEYEIEKFSLDAVRNNVPYYKKANFDFSLETNLLSNLHSHEDDISNEFSYTEPEKYRHIVFNGRFTEKMTNFATNLRISSYTLSMVYVDLKFNRLVSTDGCFMAVTDIHTAKEADDIGLEGFTINKNVYDFIVSVSDNWKIYQTEKNNVVLLAKISDTQYVEIVLNDSAFSSFPDYKMVIPKEQDYNFVYRINNVKEELEKISLEILKRKKDDSFKQVFEFWDEMRNKIELKLELKRVKTCLEAYEKHDTIYIFAKNDEVPVVFKGAADSSLFLQNSIVLMPMSQ